MKSFKELAHEIVTKVDEDAPANAVGTGANVALPPTHEPGFKKKRPPIMARGKLPGARTRFKTGADFISNIRKNKYT